MAGEEKLFYTIGEAAELIDVKPYVLRYWETEFRKLNPQKSVTGQRAYRKRDLQVAMTIKRLLYGEKYTIAGAVKKLDELDEKGDLEPIGDTPATPFKEDIPGLPSQTEGNLPPIPTEKIREMKNLIDSSKMILKKYGLN